MDPLSYFSFQPILHDWFKQERGRYYPVCGMVTILSVGWLLSCLWDGYYPVCGMVTILSVGWLLSCLWDGYYPVCGMVTILSVGWLLSCLWDGYYPVCGMVTILSVGWLLSCLWDGAAKRCTSGHFTTEPYLAPSLTKTKFKWEAPYYL